MICSSGAITYARRAPTSRSLAEVGNLYQYWFDTGYLIMNPPSGLVTGTQVRNGFRSNASWRRPRSPRSMSG